MKKILLVAITLLGMSLSSNAYVEEVSTEQYADKFKPSTGLKIKESNIAGRMENATKNAAYGGQKQEKQWAKKRTQPRANKNNSNIRSYKWF